MPDKRSLADILTNAIGGMANPTGGQGLLSTPVLPRGDEIILNALNNDPHHPNMHHPRMDRPRFPPPDYQNQMPPPQQPMPLPPNQMPPPNFQGPPMGPPIGPSPMGLHGGPPMGPHRGPPMGPHGGPPMGPHGGPPMGPPAGPPPPMDRLMQPPPPVCQNPNVMSGNFAAPVMGAPIPSSNQMHPVNQMPPMGVPTPMPIMPPFVPPPIVHYIPMAVPPPVSTKKSSKKEKSSNEEFADLLKQKSSSKTETTLTEQNVSKTTQDNSSTDKKDDSSELTVLTRYKQRLYNKLREIKLAASVKATTTSEKPTSKGKNKPVTTVTTAAHTSVPMIPPKTTTKTMGTIKIVKPTFKALEMKTVDINKEGSISATETAYSTKRESRSRDRSDSRSRRRSYSRGRSSSRSRRRSYSRDRSGSRSRRRHRSRSGTRRRSRSRSPRHSRRRSRSRSRGRRSHGDRSHGHKRRDSDDESVFKNIYGSNYSTKERRKSSSPSKRKNEEDKKREKEKSKSSESAKSITSNSAETQSSSSSKEKTLNTSSSDKDDSKKPVLSSETINKNIDQSKEHEEKSRLSTSEQAASDSNVNVKKMRNNDNESVVENPSKNSVRDSKYERERHPERSRRRSPRSTSREPRYDRSPPRRDERSSERPRYRDASPRRRSISPRVWRYSPRRRSKSPKRRPSISPKRLRRSISKDKDAIPVRRVRDSPERQKILVQDGPILRDPKLEARLERERAKMPPMRDPRDEFLPRDMYDAPYRDPYILPSRIPQHPESYIDQPMDRFHDPRASNRPPYYRESIPWAHPMDLPYDRRYPPVSRDPRAHMLDFPENEYPPRRDYRMDPFDRYPEDPYYRRIPSDRRFEDEAIPRRPINRTDEISDNAQLSWRTRYSNVEHDRELPDRPSYDYNTYYNEEPDVRDPYVSEKQTHEMKEPVEVRNDVQQRDVSSTISGLPGISNYDMSDAEVDDDDEVNADDHAQNENNSQPSYFKNNETNMRPEDSTESLPHYIQNENDSLDNNRQPKSSLSDLLGINASQLKNYLKEFGVQ